MSEVKTWAFSGALWTAAAAAATAIAAAIFFLYKAATGYLITNLSVELSQRRQAINEEKDYIVITIKLSKGDLDTIALHDVRLRVFLANKEVSLPVLVDDNLRFLVNDHDPMRPTIEFSRYDKTKPVLWLTPGEVIQFEAITEVLSPEIVRIEVAILGQSILTNYITGRRWLAKNKWVGQWRASVISLPGDKSKSPQ
jgi:hypothetical protein